MKHLLLILTVGICLLISVPAMADQAADEAAILELFLSREIITINSNSSDAISLLFLL